jgi:hypothetical protein
MIHYPRFGAFQFETNPNNPFFLLLKLTQIKKMDWCGTSVFFGLGTIGFFIVVVEDQ